MADSHGGRYFGQTQRAIDAGLSLATVESVRQGCYSDAQLNALIQRRAGEIPATTPVDEAGSHPAASCRRV